MAGRPATHRRGSPALAAEKHAAQELALFLKQVTGAEFPIQTTLDPPAGPLLLVGPGHAASRIAPELKLDNLKPDGIVIESAAEHVSGR